MLTTSKREKKAPKFLAELRENGGFVGKACETVGVSKPSVYSWRDSDPEFAAKWDEAIELATEDLEKECRRRAYLGFEEPVFYQGEVCGQVRKFSDNLLMFTLKARKPDKYRDNIRVTVEEVDSTIDAAIRAHNLPAGTENHLDSEAS